MLVARDVSGMARVTSASSSPATLKPPPLLGMFAHPTLDDTGNALHRGGDIDSALSIAGCLDRVGHFDAVAVVGKAYGADAVDRAFEPARQPRQRPADLAWTAKKYHVDTAVCDVLVHEHQ